MHGDIDADSSIRRHQSDRVDSATTVGREKGDQAHLQSRGRTIAVRVLALVGLLSFSLMFVVVASEAAGVISMEPVGAPDDPPPSEAARQGATAPEEAVHVTGALAALAVGATGLIALLIRPDRAGSSYQVLSAAVGLLAVSPIMGNPDNYGGQAGAADPAFVALAVPPLLAGLVGAPWREGVTRVNTRPVLLLAAIALAPLVAFGVDQALLQRNTFPPTADPHHQAHWFAMASFAFVVVLVVATAALGRHRMASRGDSRLVERGRGGCDLDREPGRCFFVRPGVGRGCSALGSCCASSRLSLGGQIRCGRPAGVAEILALVERRGASGTDGTLTSVRYPTFRVGEGGTTWSAGSHGIK